MPTEIPLREMEIEAFRRFCESNDLLGLSLLADWLEDEATMTDAPRPVFARLLREVAAAANPAVRWFYMNLPAVNYNPLFESLRQGNLRTACQFAWREALLSNRANGQLWRWLIQEDWEATHRLPDTAIREDEDRPLHSFFIQEWGSGRGARTGAWRTIARNEAHDMAPGDQRWRIIAAASVPQAIEQSAYPLQPKEQYPTWMLAEQPTSVEYVIIRECDAGAWNPGSQTYHPREDWSRLLLILPECPDPFWNADSGNDTKEFCLGYSYNPDTETLEPRSYKHSDFMKYTLRANPVLKRDEFNKIRDLLIQKHVTPAIVDHAPKGYRQTRAKRRDAMRQATDAANGGS